MTTTAPQREADGAVRAESRLLVLAPVGRDASLAVRALQPLTEGICVCPSLIVLCVELEAGAGAVLLTTEALDEDNFTLLAAFLKRQPPWSDLPIVLLAGGAERSALEAIALPLGNVTVLERPLPLSSLRSAVASAIRARKRQYQVRDLLAETERARQEAERQQARIKELNERLQRAMTETHHRVKNNLQIMSSMIDLQLLEGKSTVSIKEMRRLSVHIQMLAAVHDLLTKQAKMAGQAQLVPVNVMLQTLLPLMERTSGERRIRFTLEPAWMPARQSTSLALIANELVNNAFKHGKGVVEVSFTVQEALATLEVCDDGEGFPAGFDPSLAAHIGLELVENLSRRDLQGQAAYTNRAEGGARVRVVIPLPVAESVPE